MKTMPSAVRATGPKVLIVTKGLDVGGTEKHIVRIAPRLRRRGIDVSVFVLARGGELEDELTAGGVSIAGLPPSGGGSHLLRAIWALSWHMRRQRPDIAHFFLPEPYLIGSLAGMCSGVQTRIMSRRSLGHYQARHPVLARLEWQLHRHTGALIANSTAVLADLARETDDERRLGLIYNGIDIVPERTPERRAAARCALGLPQEALLLAVVANLIAYKGHADLLDALARANPRLPADWRLYVAGRDDGAGASLKKRAAALGIGEHLIWAGECRDANLVHAAADLSVLASHEEGFSNSLIEAMAHGLPVIATAVGGNLDAIVPGESGILVPVRTPEALGEAIAGLAANPGLRAKLGEAARARAMRLFSIEACVDRYVKLYRGVQEFGIVPVHDILERPVTVTAAV